MTTKDIILDYFKALKQKRGWEAFLSDRLSFTNFTAPIKQVTGRDAYIEATKRFYSMIIGVDLNDLIVDGEKACALTHYELQPPNGNSFGSDVAEIFTVKDGKIDSLGIYFDTTPFPK